ncbi:MAG TPA: type II toxin-antitoxin system VapC family toxin [Gaiellaceae bacterium]|nr:type II toxin-antitoxin system VapC family toxin [Gaiellaceae bacterium]
MTLYVDSSALLKRYVDEPDSEAADAILRADESIVTGRHTIVEVRRNLARLLDGRELEIARDSFRRDLEAIAVVELDGETCELAAELAGVTGARSLNALHLAAARRVGGTEIAVLTFDVRQAQVARSLGFTVLGA